MLYKHKYLATHRVQSILIVLNWTISIALPIVLFFFDGALKYDEEARLCALTAHRLSTAVYGVTTVFVTPPNIAAIFYHAHRQSRRVVAFVSDKKDLQSMVNDGLIFCFFL